ncbi:MAG: hypothetical protein ACKO1M_07790 [Planctomycetota bacterium]
MLPAFPLCLPTVTALALVIAPLAANAAQAAEPAPTHEIRDVLGWELHVHTALLTAAPEATATAISLLEQQLAEIVRVVPPAAVTKLRETPLWFSPEYPGVPPRAEFHPDAGLAAEQWPRPCHGPGDRVHEHSDLPAGLRADAELRPP